MPPVPGAPNRCRLTGTVLWASEPETGGRRRLRLHVTHLEPISGGLFARPGDVVDVYAFGAAANSAQQDHELTAEAEFIGGPARKVFRMR